jgi:hypothetical protein
MQLGRGNAEYDGCVDVLLQAKADSAHMQPAAGQSRSITKFEEGKAATGGRTSNQQPAISTTRMEGAR